MANKLVMTFDDFIKSPSGKGSAVNTGRDSLELSYQSKLNECISKHGEIEYKCVKGDRSYYIHFLIPSESTKGFYNDVVIELKAPSGEGSSIGDIHKYTVSFFANDPSFVFTYAHAYKTHGLLISKLERKLNIRSVLQKASTRNPDNVVGYTKGIYFAYLLMKKNNLFDKSVLDRKCIGNFNTLVNSIDSYDKKEENKKKIIKESKVSKTKDESRSKQKPSGFTGNNPINNIVSKIKGSTKTTKHTKKSKKI